MEFFAQRIAGGLVRVESPLPQDEDPIFWKPAREVVERFQQADVIVINGADFERWIASAALPLSRICDASRGFKSEFITFQTTKHRHGSGGMHSHEGIDGHTWMDPNNAVRQAERIEEALTRRWPEHAKQFRDNGQKLKADLMTLDARFRELSPRIVGVGLIASHPAYNYIAKRYNWKITNIDLPPDLGADDSFSAKQTAALNDAFRAVTGDANGTRDGNGSTNRARGSLVLFEEQPSESAIKIMLAASNPARVRVFPVVFAPVENRPAASDAQASAASPPDFLSVMRENLGRLEDALKSVDAADLSIEAPELAAPAAGGGG
jgi:hypothetical protein